MTKYLHQILFSVLSSSSAKAAKREKKSRFWKGVVSTQ